MSKKRNLKRGTKYQELLQKLQGGIMMKCAKCGRETENLSIDHIVPYAFVVEMGLRDEGYDHDWNFQVLCRPCNRLKAASFDFTDPRTLVNLKRYVALAEQYYAQ